MSTDIAFSYGPSFEWQLLYLGSSSSSSTYTQEAETLGAAGLARLAQVSELSALSAFMGLDEAEAVAKRQRGFAAFGIMRGGHLRYHMGSHFNLDAINSTVGLAQAMDFNGGDLLTVSAFMDLGVGHSRSHVANAAASSDHRLFGAGVGARYQFQGGAYLEGTARVGKAKVEFEGSYSRTGLETKYDSTTLYYSASLGGGYRFRLSDKASVTPYAAYLYTHTDADSASLTNLDGQRLHLDSINAHSLRVGVKGEWKFSESLAVQGGAAVERTFDGDAHAQLGGIALQSPSLSGTSGHLDVGLSYRPASLPGLDLRVGATARVGDVRGITGSLRAVYSF
ncbi:MAG: autotransporter outer membrane beta-barrel domain-containing protein [Succinivibrionaceae bacterium]|nr:autotransporter outer membrane beta-barrel domain-containing protein [Succinivibrionaceae bacterium]